MQTPSSPVNRMTDASENITFPWFGNKPQDVTELHDKHKQESIPLGCGPPTRPPYVFQ